MIITNIQQILQSVKKYSQTLTFEKDKNLVLDAINLINLKFEDIDSDEKEEYLKKAINISELLVNETGAGVETYISALIFYSLNAFIEDVSSEVSELDSSIKKIISGLEKIPSLKSDKISKQSENFIKLLLTITGDTRAVLIRLAEQIYTMRNIEIFDEEQKKATALQTSQLFAPMAHRLGLYKIKTELEETSMKYLNRDMYSFIAKKLSDTKAKRDIFIEDFINPIKKALKKDKLKFEIKGRPKSIFSIWKKMQKQEVPFEEVYDLFAIRIILDTELNREKAECWQVYSIITDSYRPNPKRLRDWISAPKGSGYESLHTTVLGNESKWVEVQIRTKRMDEIAEKGPAAHWKYKEGESKSSSDWLANMRDALENSNFESDNDSDAKAELYSDEIFVFTPDGDLRSIKSGYTVLDFAYSIHSRIGSTCSGALVNDKITPISYELKNGDTIKILTSKNKKPNSEWLKIAKSTRVKHKIKRALKEQHFKDSEVGKEIIKQKLQQLKIDFTEVNVLKLTNYFKQKNPLNLYQLFGEGKYDAHKIKKAFEAMASEKNIKKEEVLREIKTPSEEKTKKANTDFLLIDENISSLDYQFAKCCNPIPGDRIFGFITVSKGTRIHKKSCPNAKDLIKRYPYRVISAKWNVKDNDANFNVNLQITGHDQTGITASISNIITDEFKLKITAISLTARKDGMFEGTVIFTVKDRSQLIQVINRIRRIKDITLVKEKL